MTGEQRRDKRTVKDVVTDNGVIVIKLQAGTGALARGLDLLKDELAKGASGYPVQVVHRGKMIATQMSPSAVSTKAAPSAPKVA